MPRWKESQEFANVTPSTDSAFVEVYDENSKATDELLGSADFLLEKLLRKRCLQMELRDGATPTGSYLTLMCIQL
jgi:hypothetical protein